MAMSAGGPSGAITSDINVTPMIDVLLVLLIIFMITQPLSRMTIRVQIPPEQTVTKQQNAANNQIERRGMRRLTLLICREGQYPSFFTLRKEAGTWKELSTIRDIEPALAFQLELARLSNFTLQPCPTENRQVHIYYAVGKDNSSDCRFFVRALVRPGRLRGNMKTVDYLVSESDRLVTDVLDTLEVVSASKRAADGNHISVRPHFRSPPSL